MHSVAFNGIEAVPIEVEVDVARRGFAGAVIVAVDMALAMKVPSSLGAGD